jgi:cell division protein FtsQ
MDRRGGIVTVTTEPRTDDGRPARPAIDPRIRERRIEVIREAGRRRLRITLVVASTIVVLGLVYLTVHSPVLDVDHIRVSGARHERTADIVAATGVKPGAPMFWVDAGRIAERLEGLPWVEHARVARAFPGTINIKVVEYEPTAYVRVAPDRVALVATTGRVVAFAAAPAPGAIEVKSPTAKPEVGALVTSPVVARVPLSLPGRLRAHVTAITLQPEPTLVLRPGEPEVRLGRLTELRQKGVSALAVLDELAGRPTAYIDVAAPQAPVSRPR